MNKIFKHIIIAVFLGSIAINLSNRPVYAAETCTEESEDIDEFEDIIEIEDEYIYSESHEMLGAGTMPMALTYLTTYNGTDYYKENATQTYTLSGTIKAYFFSGDRFLYISGSGSMPDYTYSVRPPWESYKNSITDVKIESGITSVSAYAFYFYDSLLNAELPDSIAVIGKASFYYCTSLESIGVRLPSSLTTVCDSAFVNCQEMELSGNLPAGLTRIESYGFCNCLKISLTGTLPSSLAEIDFSGFYNCKELALSGEIPSSLWKIDGTAFQLCNKVTFTGQLPGTLKEIGDSAFSGCKSITFSGTLPEGLEKLGRAAFEFCENIEITGALPSTLTEIESFVFKDCDYDKTHFDENLSPIDITESMRIPVKVPIEDRVKTRTGAYLGIRYEFKEVGYCPSYYPWDFEYEGYEYMHPEDRDLRITLEGNGGTVPTFYALWDVEAFYTIRIPASFDFYYSLENDRFEGSLTMYVKGQLNRNKKLIIYPGTRTSYMWGVNTNTRIPMHIYQNISEFVDEAPQAGQAVIKKDVETAVILDIDTEYTVLDIYRGDLNLRWETRRLGW